MTFTCTGIQPQASAKKYVLSFRNSKRFHAAFKPMQVPLQADLRNCRTTKKKETHCEAQGCLQQCYYVYHQQFLFSLSVVQELALACKLQALLCTEWETKFAVAMASSCCQEELL